MSDAYRDCILPLDPESRWIRVFDLQPAHSGNEEEPIRGQLRVVCLDHNPSYSALSYAWGKPLPSSEIIHNDRDSLSVTVNCYNALQQLRHRSRTRTIWVDSICINQDDEGEKSHEVSLMRDIYGRAKSVYIWLGKGTPQSDCAMDWLTNATLDLSPLTVARIAPFPEFLRPRDLFKLLRMILDSARLAIHHRRPESLKDTYDAEAMKDLINRDWFRRVWTIQELVMAQEPIVICGEKSIRWNNLHWGIWSAKSLGDDKEDGANYSEVTDSVLVAQSFWIDNYIISELSEAPVSKWLLRGRSPESSPFRKRFLQFMSDRGWALAYTQMAGIVLIILARMSYGLRPLNSRGLLALIFSAIATVVFTPPAVFKDHERSVRGKIVPILNRTRTRQATKQVDRVYALHGVFQKLGIPIQKPDYGKSVGEVYCEFTRTMIIWLESLDILTEASTPALPDTPSWVPDWSTRYQRICNSGSRAAKDSSAVYSFSDCGRKLQTSGILADTLICCAKMLEEPNDGLFSSGNNVLDPAVLFTALHNVRVLRDLIPYALQMCNKGRESFSEALFETIHSELDFENTEKSNLRRDFNQWFEVLTADYSNCSTICPPEMACALTLSMSTSLNRYHLGRCRAIADKKLFFVTSKGHIGAGPTSMLVDDTLAIISGLRTPLILRKAGPCYELIGAAYVHGIMYGEAWPEDKSELLDLTLI